MCLLTSSIKLPYSRLFEKGWYIRHSFRKLKTLSWSHILSTSNKKFSGLICQEGLRVLVNNFSLSLNLNFCKNHFEMTFMFRSLAFSTLIQFTALPKKDMSVLVWREGNKYVSMAWIFVNGTVKGHTLI